MWTVEQVDVLRRMAKAGKTGSEIAALFGTTRSAILGKAHREGIHLHGHRDPEKHRALTSVGVKASWSRDDGTRRQQATDRLKAWHDARRAGA